MARRKKPIMEYRHYNLPLNFPVLLLSGEACRLLRSTESLHP